MLGVLCIQLTCTGSIFAFSGSRADDIKITREQEGVSQNKMKVARTCGITTFSENIIGKRAND